MSVIDVIKEKLDEPVKDSFKESCLRGLKETNEMDTNETLLGEATTLELQLFLLTNVYRREVKKLEATAMMLEDPTEMDRSSLSHEVHIKKNLADLCREMMFLEVNIRFSDTLKNLKSSGVSLMKRGDRLVFVSFESAQKEIPGFLKGLLGGLGE